MQPAEQLDDLRVKPVNVHLKAGLLAHLPDVLLDFLVDLRDDLLDPRRVDPAVLDQALQRHPRHLAPHRVKPGQDNRFRRVVNDDVDARRAFQRPDIAAFTADNAAFHLVVGKRHHRHRRVRHMVGRATLHRLADDPPGLLVRILDQLVLDTLQPKRRIALHLGLELGKNGLAAPGRPSFPKSPRASPSVPR